MRDCPDTMAYLAKYLFDQTYMVDTCEKVQNGYMLFSGKKPLDKGVYILLSQAKAPYFEFLVNESQNFTINASLTDIISTLNAPDNKENQQFFSLLKFTDSKNKEYHTALLSTAGKSKKDSAAFMQQKILALEKDTKKFDDAFMHQIKGSFLYDILNLKTEKQLTDVPKAQNGRPDSLYAYYYYKSHYFDGVDFKDERIARTPYFDDRIKNYFDYVLVSNPDTVIKEVDKILALCDGNYNYALLMGYLTYKYEQSTVVGFDKVFLHLVDNYILTGKTKGVYSEETIENLRQRSLILNPLLTGKLAPNLYMMDTLDGYRIKKMGFDTARSTASAAQLYAKHKPEILQMFKTLHQVDAKYTILLFWSPDCGHCQKVVPELHKNLKELKGKLDFKVFAVQIKDDQFDQWRHFLIQNNMTDFINVFDPIHINNLKDKFDVYSTPVVYVLDKDKKIMAKKIDPEHLVGFLNNIEKASQKNHN